MAPARRSTRPHVGCEATATRHATRTHRQIACNSSGGGERRKVLQCGGVGAIWVADLHEQRHRGRSERRGLGANAVRFSRLHGRRQHTRRSYSGGTCFLAFRVVWQAGDMEQLLARAPIPARRDPMHHAAPECLPVPTS